MPQKRKLKFNGSGVVKALTWPFRAICTGGGVLFLMIGGFVTFLGGLVTSEVNGMRTGKEIDAASSFTLNEKKYSLVDDKTVKIEMENEGEGYTMVHEYDFVARVKVIRKIEVDNEGDVEVLERNIIRFENLDASSSPKDAMQAGLEISRNLQTAFDGAKDRWFFDDDTPREKIVKEASEFLENYTPKMIEAEDAEAVPAQPKILEIK